MKIYNIIYFILTSKYDIDTLYFISSLVLSIALKRSFKARAIIPGSLSVPNMVNVFPAPKQEKSKHFTLKLNILRSVNHHFSFLFTVI